MSLGFQINFFLKAGYIHVCSEDGRGGKALPGPFLGFSRLGWSTSTHLGAAHAGGCCSRGLTPRITFWTEAYPGNMALFLRDKQLAL